MKRAGTVYLTGLFLRAIAVSNALKAATNPKQIAGVEGLVLIYKIYCRSSRFAEGKDNRISISIEQINALII
jgi:hypothetical protein